MGRWLGPLIAGVLLGAVAGASVCWFMFGEEGGALSGLDAAARTRRESASDARDASSPQPALAAPSYSVERTSDPAAESTGAAPTELVDRVTSLARHAPVPEGRRGEKSIKGRVTDTRGRPIAGVVVRVTRQGDDGPGTPSRSETGRAPPPPPSLEETIRKAVEQYYERGSDFREAQSDADGRYAIGELRVGRYGIEAWREGFRFSQASENDMGWVRPDATVDFTGRPVIAAPVAVEMPDGKPAPTALVWYTSRSHGSESSAWSPQEPTIPLPPGEFELRASLGDPNSGPPWPEFLSSDAANVTVTEGEAPPLSTIRLKSEPGVRGHVLKPDGGYAARAQVRLLLQPSGAPDPKRLAEDPESKSWWTENGEFLFKDLKPGRYALGAGRDWRRISATAIVEVQAGMVVQDLVLPELDVASCIVVRVTDHNGDVVTDANFQWRVEREKNNVNQNDVMLERKEPGLWWVPVESAGGGDFDPLKPWPPQTRLFLITWADGLGSTAVEIYQATRNVSVKFGPPATLLVTVPGYVSGDYVGRVNFSLERAGDGVSRNAWGSGGQPDKDDGVARIGPVEAGRYRLAMYVSDKGQQRWQQSEVAATELTLSPGDNHASMSIPQLYTLVVRMPPAGAEGGGRLQMQPIGKTIQRYRQSEVKDGTATFGELAPGWYRLTCTGGSTPGVMQVTIPVGGPVAWAPMAVNALRVVLQDTSGQLSAAGFRDGDVIVAIEGKEITSLLDLQLLQAASRVAKTVSLTVQRGGEQTPITLESRYVNDPNRLGGSLEPSTR